MLLALDISTSVIGVSVFDDENTLYELSYVKLSKKDKSLFKKLDEFIEYMKKYEQFTFTEIAIEEPLLRFAGKFSNANTIQKLTQMNSLISGYLYKKYNIEPVYYNVQTARKTAFPALTIPKGSPNSKYLIWKAFVEKYPTINWEYSKRTFKLVNETFDAVDSAVVGLAHIATVNKILKQTT